LEKAMKRVVILGGGFAGVEAAIYLRKEQFDVTLVSDREFFYIYPTSIWIPTGGTSMEKICVGLDALKEAHGFDTVVDRVESVSMGEKRVTLASGKRIEGDYMIIALGAGKMKHPGSEHTLSICGSPADASALKERLEALIQKGSGTIAMGFGGNPNDTSAVRGGPAFELLFNVHHHLKKLGKREQFQLEFFAPMAQPGARMGPQALGMMETMFSTMQINRHFGKKIKRFEHDGVVFEDESRLKSDLTMFIPAGNGHPVIQESDLPCNAAGFVTINDYGQVTNGDRVSEQVYAIGDVAALEGPDWRAKQGHIAEVMARNAAFNIIAAERGSEERKGYAEHINILCVMDSGNGAAFVYRDHKGGKMIPMPIVGHWMKRGWGWYCRNSKLGKIPRLPFM
jgi:sulfide:quinone oxidoreductase